MRKFLENLFDVVFILGIMWLIWLSSYIEFSTLLWLFFGSVALFFLTSSVCSAFARRRKLESQMQASRIAAEAEKAEQERREIEAFEYKARQERLAAEHEARRPICEHCGKKTECIFQYRKLDGGPDHRYRNNPMLCNRCFKPFSPIRPWNLPKND